MKLFKLILTEEESNMIYDSLRNHIDYVACEDNEIGRAHV